MSGQIPPSGARMRPVVHELTAGTRLWRLHLHRYGGQEFNPRLAHEFFRGSRFDGTEQDPYASLYAALDPVTALSEVLLRSVDFDDATGTRLVPWAQASRYRLSVLRTTEDLTLVDLTTAEGLAGVWQDSWLVDCEEPDYPKTRYWARLIRRHCPEPAGLLWQSKRCRPRPALQLFGDRCEEKRLRAEPEAALRLDDPGDVREVNALLEPLRARISVPDDLA
ncbi:RES family NAD+ phosphorylase [Streptomyces sp. NPDC051079]|uniref:RES family NAD+ phosphorylase n=1 Tax=Streptomyces sp. NPDC051079 TaxID=3155043 RepID=UPI003450CEB1